ncbi:MAG TPA: cyclic nucleotide-binding domain-containing protein [Xanthobacteraceae bacterium]|nr:cyclic nucleotide-binding domain-containing protein [Xanthobacteraceae bacterium]
MSQPLSATVSSPSLIDSAALRTACRTAHFARGDVLRHKGVHYNDMLFLTGGQVEVFRGDGAEPIRLEAPGTPIGEIGFLRGSPATATVTAITEMNALLLDDAAMARLDREQPALVAQMLRELADTAEERTSYNLVFAGRDNGATKGKTEILLCRTPEMLERAQRLRYEVYCVELGRKSPNADHERKILADELDAFGHVFIAVQGDDVIGTIRGNISSEGELGAIADTYGMTGSPFHPAATGVCTKFMVKKEKRGSPISMRLIGALTRYGFNRQIQECYGNCVPSLLHYYEALGFMVCGPKFLHPENGVSYPIKVDLTKHGERLGGDRHAGDYMMLFVKAQAIRLFKNARRWWSRTGG